MSQTATPTLPEALRRALVERIEGGGLELPLLPEVARQVLSIGVDGECATKELADLIHRDPAMAGHILRLANTARYAPPIPIVTLQQAVSRLGLKKIREIAMIVSCESRLFAVDGYERRLRMTFRHCLAAGLFAQEIARMRRWNVEEAFLCGLLHDVGLPVLLQTIVDLRKKLPCEVDPDAIDAFVREQHAAVGRQLVERWHLSPRLAETILHHHDPDSAPNCAQPARMTRLADDLSHLTVHSAPMSEEHVRRHPLNAALNLYPDEMDRLLAQRPQILSNVETLA